MSDTTQAPWNIKRLLEWTTERFEQASASSPRLEAEILLAEALECQRIQLYTQYDVIPEADPMAKFRDWVKRRSGGEPVAYIVGYREFYSLRFDVTPDVLIPRPETEHLIVAALEAAKGYEDRPLRVVDVGTGSGCVAVTLAKHLPTPHVIAATDLSADALIVARQNAESHEVKERIRFCHGDLLAALPESADPVHLIVSNPPYIGDGEVDTVEDDVKNFEPHGALFAGPTGTEIIERLIEQAPDMLLPGGQLIFEASPTVMDRCVELVNASAGLEFVEVIRDLAGLDRILVAKKA